MTRRTLIDRRNDDAPPPPDYDGPLNRRQRHVDRRNMKRPDRRKPNSDRRATVTYASVIARFADYVKNGTMHPDHRAMCKAILRVLKAVHQ